jgi:type IV pilus assembly protein PilO
MNFSEMSGIKQWGVLLGIAALISVALYMTLFKSQRDDNQEQQQKLEAKLRENKELEAYKPKLAEMERQLANLKQQLDIERKIVPDEKEVDNFMRMMDAEAVRAGVELRRYTARPVSQRDFYSEVPFEMDLDGPYYSMLNFFDRVGKLERIVNVSNLVLASTRKPNEAHPKKLYQYAPNESVVATCVATTFFSHDIVPPTTTTAKPAAATGKK